jgi:hypothetical protein
VKALAFDAAVIMDRRSLRVLAQDVAPEREACYTSALAREVLMVTRNGRFSTPPGYSRQHEKRDVERLVAEDLATEPAAGNAALERGTAPRSGPRVVLELGPRAQPRIDLDLHALAHEAVRAEPVGPGLVLLQLAQRCGRRLWQVGGQLGRRTLRAAGRQGRRLLDWISWK